MASFNKKITGFFKKALALANLCISPPETRFSLVKNYSNFIKFNFIYFNFFIIFLKNIYALQNLNKLI
jgi:hypothetical protein